MGTTTVYPVEFGTKTKIKCSDLRGAEILNIVPGFGYFTVVAFQFTWSSSDVSTRKKEKTQQCV
jgi:hypothetical protein